MSQERSVASGQARPRWDVVVRLTHWGIVIAVVANALATEEGSAAHIWIGYGLAALLALRLVWGLIGPSEARFTAFPPNPRAALDHIRNLARGDHRVHGSHNPLGALNVYAIWLCLAVIIGSGIAMAGSPPMSAESRMERSHADSRHVQEEPAEDDIGGSIRSETATGSAVEEEGEAVEEVHGMAVYLLYLLIALHLGGILFETRRSGPGLVARMLPGRR